MRVFICGATGAVGRPLVRMLRERGHEVLGSTRSAERAGVLAALGAEAVVCDALDADSVRGAVLAHQPEVIVNQLSALSAPLNPRRYAEWLQPTNRLRTVGTGNLVAAASAAGTERLISQSLAFAYRWGAPGLRTEDDPLFDGQTEFADAVDALRELERLTLETPGIAGTVLRYGYFYGPGTAYAPGGDVAELVRKRRFPIVGAGTGRIPFVHVDDAAAATVAAIERGARGVFNVVDDEAAEVGEFLATYASGLGARAPMHVPLWLARLASSRFLADAAVQMPGASNARAKQELGWEPRWRSWREGFAHAPH